MKAKSEIRKAVWILVALAMWVPPSAAQLQIGDNLKMNVNGTVGFGYGGNFSDPGASGHNLNMLGRALVTGSYYDPKFLNFTVQPYYNRNQNNTSSLSIFNDSGVNASANLFSGSHFPGFVGYGRNFNNTGEFGIPGTVGLTTRGSRGDIFGRLERVSAQSAQRHGEFLE